MRFLAHFNQSKSEQSAGFTLVEMLVIAPIVILMIGGFIGLMVTMVGGVMVTRDENQMMFDSQNALNSIEQDTRLSIQFMSATTGTQSPQGTSSNFTGTGEFNNTSNTLILRTLATDKNPSDSSRQLVYYANQPNACGSSQSSNQIYALTVVYFIKDGSLWRRSIMPLNNTTAPSDINTVCNAPWQLNSCSPGYSATRCQTNDVEMMRGVTSMAVKYYSDPASTTDLGASNASVASSIDVTINGNKDVAGRNIATTQSIIATKLNDMPQNVGPTALDISQHPVDKAVLATAINVQFTASSNYNTASLQWQRSINGGTAWTNIAGATTKTLTLTTVSLSMDSYKYRLVATDSGMTATSNPATLNVSVWLPLDLQNGWVPYSATYGSQAEYTQTSSGIVVIRGLVKNGDETAGSTIATLPTGLRPSGRLVLATSAYNSTATATNTNVNARVDVHSNGNITFQTGTSGWYSLNLMFVPSGTSHTWQTPTYDATGGWSNYGSGYETVRATADTTGRIFTQGLARSGTSTAGTNMFSYPTAYRPPRAMHFVAGHDYFGGFWINNAGMFVKRGPQTVGFLGVNAVYMPTSYSAANWTNLTLGNGWTNYSTTYPDAQFTKTSDNIVTLQGLIRNGSTAVDTLIGTLPAGYRPNVRMIFTSNTNDGYGRLDVLPDGRIFVRYADAAWASLNNISFYAQQ